MTHGITGHLRRGSAIPARLVAGFRGRGGWTAGCSPTSLAVERLPAQVRILPSPL